MSRVQGEYAIKRVLELYKDWGIGPIRSEEQRVELLRAVLEGRGVAFHRGKWFAFGGGGVNSMGLARGGKAARELIELWDTRTLIIEHARHSRATRYFYVPNLEIGEGDYDRLMTLNSMVIGIRDVPREVHEAFLWFSSLITPPDGVIDPAYRDSPDVGRFLLYEEKGPWTPKGSIITLVISYTVDM